MSFTDYFQLAKAQRRFLAFGFLLTFMSSGGQTYFIGIFGPEIRNTFDLSHTEWGSIYLAGTLTSALVLPWTGQLIDRFDLRIYTAIVLTGLVVACLAISLAPSVLFVILGIFLLRQTGQGLCGHTSITSMARYIAGERGKAIAIASMGYSTGEAVLPLLAVLGITAWGWRFSYQLTALALVFLIPLALWLLTGHTQRHQLYVDQQRVDSTNGNHNRDRTRAQVLKERRFYLLMPAVLAPSFILTAMFFHHLTMAEIKGWSGLWVTGTYWIYAVATVITSLVTGPLIGRLSAARIVPYYVVPLMLALALLFPAGDPLWVLPYMLLIGINTGYYFTAINALWAELYGSSHLGAIKSLVGSAGVFASALGPVSLGVLLDIGLSFEMICLLFAVFCGAATLLLVYGLNQPHEV